jgi:hypothetical protein
VIQGYTGWCASCNCGWESPIDAFEVRPPEKDCKNVVCDCHESYWDSIPEDVVDQGPSEVPPGEELLLRYQYGDR